MRLETIEEQVLLEVAEELSRLSTQLKAIDRLSDAMRIDDLVNEMTSNLTWIRASREQDEKVGEKNATAGGEPTVATGEENMETLRVRPSVADQLRSILGQTG